MVSSCSGVRLKSSPRTFYGKLGFELYELRFEFHAFANRRHIGKFLLCTEACDSRRRTIARMPELPPNRAISRQSTQISRVMLCVRSDSSPNSDSKVIVRNSLGIESTRRSRKTPGRVLNCGKSVGRRFRRREHACDICAQVTGGYLAEIPSR